MAVVNTKSTAVTGADAVPAVRPSAYVSAGVLRESVGTVETAAADDELSVYRLVRVPSNARISSILLGADAITAASAADVGVYQTAANGGAALDADFFAADVDISSGIVFTEELLQATVTDKDKVEKRLWELFPATYTVDPQRDFDLCVTVNDVTAAGTISMKVKFTV